VARGAHFLWQYFYNYACLAAAPRKPYPRTDLVEPAGSSLSFSRASKILNATRHIGLICTHDSDTFIHLIRGE
jgi:hypothetical protein